VNYKLLHIFLEGDDDERFCSSIIKPRLEGKYDFVQFYCYAAKTPKKIENFIKSIAARNADFFIMTDINHSPCITHKKEELKKKKIKYKTLNGDNIIVVIKEIESWYLAGLTAKGLEKLNINSKIKETDNLTKEQFDRLIPSKFVSRIDFMQEVLKHFHLETARRKNKSFNYFFEKYISEK
jgi:hypothetical protein